jgi:hypothetical protein
VTSKTVKILLNILSVTAELVYIFNFKDSGNNFRRTLFTSQLSILSKFAFELHLGFPGILTNSDEVNNYTSE